MANSLPLTRMDDKHVRSCFAGLLKTLILALILAVVWLASITGCAAEASAKEELAVDIKVEDLFQKVRNPKIVVAADGTVLAYANLGGLLRRSEDGGSTWSNPQVPGKNTGGNVVVDTTTGDILMVRPSRGYLWRSKDNGKTWAQETFTIKANPYGHGTLVNNPVDAACSESGITLQYGEHKGRLLVPGRIRPPLNSNAQETWPYHYNTSIYSDDGGKTWQVSGPVQTGTGEGTLAEMSNGDIYYNSRSHMSVDHRRRIAWSYDGGATYVDWRVDDVLREVGQPFYFKYGTEPSYGCNAGLVRLPLETTGGKDVLVFSTPDDPGGERVRMSVWASFDRGKTWPVKRLIYEGPSSYSSLTADKKGNIYLLFEKGTKKLYESIALAKFDLNWLTQGHDLKQLLNTPVVINRPLGTRPK